MPLVDLLPVLDASKDLDGEEVLRYAYGRLQKDEDIGDQSQDAVGGFEASLRAGSLVDLDDGEGRDEGEDSSDVKDEVYPGALTFLRRGMGWLKDEDCLGGEKYTAGIEQLPRVEGGRVRDSSIDPSELLVPFSICFGS